MPITSAYLTAGEMRGLRELAAREGIAFNALIRVAVRLLLGQEVPPWARELAARHEEEHAA